MRILSIDPALNNTGWCIADYVPHLNKLTMINGGLIVTEKASQKTIRRSSDDLRRATEIATELKRLSQGIDIVFAEIPNGGAQNSRAVWSLGIVLGVLTNVAHLSLVEVTPTMTKMASVGRKDATKAEIIEWSVGMYPDLPWYKARGAKAISPRNEHMADAVAILHAGLIHEDFGRYMAILRKFSASRDDV